MKKDEIEIIKLDYEKTLSVLDKIENLLFQIKNWAVISCSAIIVFGISQKSMLILCTNFFLVLAFCFLEIIYKSFHEDCLEKSYKLEELITQSLVPTSQLPENYQFGIGHKIEPVKIKRAFAIFSNKERWHIRAFYLLIILSTTIALVLVDLLHN